MNWLFQEEMRSFVILVTGLSHWYLINLVDHFHDDSSPLWHARLISPFEIFPKPSWYNHISLLFWLPMYPEQHGKIGGHSVHLSPCFVDMSLFVFHSEDKYIYKGISYSLSLARAVGSPIFVRTSVQARPALPKQEMTNEIGSQSSSTLKDYRYLYLTCTP